MPFQSATSRKPVASKPRAKARAVSRPSEVEAEIRQALEKGRGAWLEMALQLPSDVDRGEHVLQICESAKRPEPMTQIGTLTKDGVCALCFDLVPAERIEG